MTHDELAAIYNKKYPAVVYKSFVNKKENLRKRFIFALLNDTTLDTNLIQVLVDKPGLYNYCQENGIWPCERQPTVKVKPRREQEVRLKGNRRDIQVEIRKIKKLVDAKRDLLGEHFSIKDTLEEYFDSEIRFHLENKKKISDAIVNLIMSMDPEDHKTIRGEKMTELKDEVSRHDYVMAELTALGKV